ncbi:MAG: hypothetical protein A2Y22_04690 [Clostridiales bacterium GWD2_32_59]|nr:MAG: hypothetical protein A2Y22_04690 [Clostridiales bacterium GWD2_32_59]
MLKNNKGFTLLELLAVLVILAALAMIAIPIFTNKGEEARTQSNNVNIQEIQKVAQSYEWDKDSTVEPTTFYGEITEGHPLVVDGYLKEEVKNPWEN